MIYDLIIIGLGPSGVTAGIYAYRYELKTLMLGKEFGGIANEAYKVENYPGFESIKGLDLMKKFKESVDYLKIPYELKDVEKIEKVDSIFNIFTGDKTYQAKTLIMATGTEVKRLNIPGEKELAGRGVSYCATCDGQFFRDKTVAVIGAGDAGATTCLMLSKIAKKIYWIYIEDIPIAMPFWLKKVEETGIVEKISQNTLLEIKGDKKVEKIILSKNYKGEKEIKVDGVFVQVGVSPIIDLVKDLGVEMDKQKHIIVDEAQMTNIEGLFAAGDVTDCSNRFKQIITACGEGAVATFGVYHYIKNN